MDKNPSPIAEPVSIERALLGGKVGKLASPLRVARAGSEAPGLNKKRAGNAAFLSQGILLLLQERDPELRSGTSSSGEKQSCRFRGQPGRLRSLLSRKYQESSAPERVTSFWRKWGNTFRVWYLRLYPPWWCL